MASPRSAIPSPATLGLSRATATADLQQLGWTTEEHVPLLWSLAAAGDPNLTLNTLVRICRSLEDDGAQLLAALAAEESFRVRLFALLGASTALGDHLAAHPQLWPQLRQPLPTAPEMMTELLSVVSAQPAEFCADLAQEDTATADLSTPGTYRSAPLSAAIKAELKAAYRTIIMRIAAHDLAGSFYSRKGQTQRQPEVDFATVTALTTAAADAALTAALALAVRVVYDDAPVDATVAVIAMGKCGARELNYISDVDVIFVAEPIATDEAAAATALRNATRTAAEFISLGSSLFFDVDAALRPEGKSGALVRSVDSHLAYYRRWAETWEFQALLKARPQTGYLPLGYRYEEQISPLVWQASQRESFVDDVQAMRRRVLDNVPAALKTRELKLGEGGLRDVEFAVQLLQLVHGRADESLRVRSTVDALAALVAAGYIGREDGSALIEAYEFLRLLEHRLQLERFRRTHTMPPDDDDAALTWLARISGFYPQGAVSAAEGLGRTLKEHRMQISQLHSRLFYRPLLHSVVELSHDELRLTPQAAQLQLAALGYGDPQRAFEHLSALASGSTRRDKIQAILLPTLMGWLAHTADPDAGLLNYRKLSEAAEDRTWFLRMLRDEGVVGQRLMAILGTSPYTADLIIAAPETVKLLSDGAAGPRLREADPEQVGQSLINATKRHADPQRAVAIARALRREELARIAAADLLGFMDVGQVCRELSMIWNAVLEAALRAEIRAWQGQQVNADAEQHQDVPQPPARIAIIGMGRLGGMELGFGSDADVMVVAQPAEEVTEDEAIKWAISIIDAMRRRLSQPSGDPPLEVDLGLRPEGRSGAVVRTIASYQRYYRQWAEPWEFQALLRAAVVAGDREVGQEFMTMIDQFRYPDQGASAETIRSIRRMKARVDNERLPRGADRNTHTKLGRGALTDIEWTVQLLTMMHAHTYPALRNPATLGTLDVIEAEGILPSHQVSQLREAWLLATDARNALVLVRGKRVDQLPTPGKQLGQVAGAAGWAPEDNQAFLEHYLRVTRHARQVVDEVFWGEVESFEHD